MEEIIIIIASILNASNVLVQQEEQETIDIPYEEIKE